MLTQPKAFVVRISVTIRDHVPQSLETTLKSKGVFLSREKSSRVYVLRVKMFVCLCTKYLGVHAEVFLPPGQVSVVVVFVLPGKCIDLEKQLKSSHCVNMNLCPMPCLILEVLYACLQKHKYEASLAN